MALRLAKEGDAGRDIRSDDEDDPYDEVDAKEKEKKGQIRPKNDKKKRN